LQKVLTVLTAPIVLVQHLSIHWAEDGKYLRWLYILHPPAMAAVALFFLEQIDTAACIRDHCFGFWSIYVMILSLGVSVAVFFTTKAGKPPRYDAVFLVVGFLMSCLWISSLADELVALLNALGDIIGIPKAILGLSVLAWGNSVGDLVSNTLMARKGFSEIALNASFSAPLVHLLVGLGVAFFVKTLKSPDQKVVLTSDADNPDLNNTIFLSFCFVIGGLIMTMIWVPAARFKFTRPMAAALLLIYLSFMVVGTLDVLNFLFPNYSLWQM